MGVQTDPNGHLHMRARYYSPDTRRFLNADPIGFDGGSNWYAFVDGNSVMGVDPLGLDVVYLLDRDAVGGRAVNFFFGRPAGHAAAMVGNDASGWMYFSYGPGPDGHNGVMGWGNTGSLDNLDIRTYPEITLQQALQKLDSDRMGDSRPHHSGDYDDYARWKTTPESDRRAVPQFLDSMDSDYWITGWNCDDVVVEALKAAGIDFQEAWRPVISYENNASNANEVGVIK